MKGCLHSYSNYTLSCLALWLASAQVCGRCPRAHHSARQACLARLATNERLLQAQGCCPARRTCTGSRGVEGAVQPFLCALQGCAVGCPSCFPSAASSACSTQQAWRQGSWLASQYQYIGCARCMPTHFAKPQPSHSATDQATTHCSTNLLYLPLGVDGHHTHKPAGCIAQDHIKQTLIV